jgi:hypothetical protein
VPWVEDDFNFSISGGIEPGETYESKLNPNQFSDWGKTPKDRNDMIFTVEIKNVAGPDGEKFIDSNFNESEYERKAERLESLKGTLAALKSQ